MSNLEAINPEVGESSNGEATANLMVSLLD